MLSNSHPSPLRDVRYQLVAHLLASPKIPGLKCDICLLLDKRNMKKKNSPICGQLQAYNCVILWVTYCHRERVRRRSPKIMDCPLPLTERLRVFWARNLQRRPKLPLILKPVTITPQNQAKTKINNFFLPHFQRDKFLPCPLPVSPSMTSEFM